MAKKEMLELTVKGKYATAVVDGCSIQKKLVKLNEEQKESRELILDKTTKIPDGNQSVRLVVTGCDETALLSAKRSVEVTATDELKTALLAGKFNGTIDFTRTIALDNPADLEKVMAILNVAQIPAKIDWSVKTTAVKLDKFTKANGANQLLADTCKTSDTLSVTFEV